MNRALQMCLYLIKRWSFKFWRSKMRKKMIEDVHKTGSCKFLDNFGHMVEQKLIYVTCAVNAIAFISWLTSTVERTNSIHAFCIWIGTIVCIGSTLINIYNTKTKTIRVRTNVCIGSTLINIYNTKTKTIRVRTIVCIGSTLINIYNTKTKTIRVRTNVCIGSTLINIYNTKTEAISFSIALVKCDDWLSFILAQQKTIGRLHSYW